MYVNLLEWPFFLFIQNNKNNLCGFLCENKKKKNL